MFNEFWGMPMPSSNPLGSKLPFTFIRPTPFAVLPVFNVDDSELHYSDLFVCGHRAIAFCALRRRLSAACSCDSADRSSTNRRFRRSRRSGCAAKSVELISTVAALLDSMWQQRNKALQSSILTRKSRKFSVARDFRCDLAVFD
jgi:hypothetical protein